MSDSEIQIKQTKFHDSPSIFPALSAFVVKYSYYWLVPYWCIEFLINLCKDRVLSEGVAPVDWVCLIGLVATASFMVFFGLQTLRLPACGFLWGFIITSLLSIFFTAWTMTLANTVLFLEFVFTILTLILLIIKFVMVIISFFILRQPQRITLM